MLRRRFAGAHIHAGSALDLAPLADAGLQVGAVVSGLPLRAMPDAAIEAIMRGAFCCLRSDASLFQFTYGWRNPIPASIMHKLGLRARKLGSVWKNLPPAAVYRIERA